LQPSCAIVFDKGAHSHKLAQGRAVRSDGGHGVRCGATMPIKSLDVITLVCFQNFGRAVEESGFAPQPLKGR
jgi:hypothetical protein